VVTATFEGAAPKAPFKFKWKEKNGSFTKNVGLLHWQMPPDEPAKAGMAGVDGYFRTYCAEALVGIVAGNMNRFEVQRPEYPEGYGLPNTEEGLAQAERRATYVRELFGRYYPASIRGDDVDAPIAFQIALWEIIHESQLPEGSAAPFSLFTGHFQADYPNPAESPSYVQKAEVYLQTLVGSDVPFYSNPDLESRELVRLKGAPNAAGEVAQSQFALQYTRGGAAGFNGAVVAPLGGLPVGGTGGGVGGVGGLGRFGPGLFPFGGFGGGGSNNIPSTTQPTVPVGNTPPTTTTTTPPTSNITVPPTNNTPPGTTPPDVVPPVNGPGGPSPVPAPPAVALGVIAVGAIVGRRAFLRRAAAKD
jgi:hypothetical protein